MVLKNKVKDYYETAVIFLSLPISARYLIGAHFKIIQNEALVFGNQDDMDERIFRTVFENNIYEEFKKFTKHFKKARGDEFLEH